MSDMPFPHSPISPQPLSLRAKQAAKALGVSERLLWTLTNQGKIPHARVGRAVLYPVVELERWLQAQTEGRADR